ncbi:MAG: amidohydrolase family protein [Candidatus Promineifilaceae bacterium]
MIVNCHTHLELGWLHYLCPKTTGESFPQWMEKLVKRSAKAREAGRRDELMTRSIEQGIASLKAAGTTHVGDITQSGLSIEPLFASGLSGVVYIEVLGMVREVGMFMVERAIQIVEEFRPKQTNMHIGITAHAPYSTHPDVFRATADYCIANDVPLCIHIAESPAETEFLRTGAGPLYEMNKRFGLPDQFNAPQTSPVQYLHDLGVLAAKPLLVHVVQVDETDLDLIAHSGSKIAHCPRSNTLLQCGRFPLEKALARHIPVALGTDSLASSPSLNIAEELAYAQQLHQAHVSADTLAELLHTTQVF